MHKSAKVAAFEGGALNVLASDTSSREVVLALPLTRLLVKMVRVKAEEDPIAVATPVLKALSPFPDDPLLVSCEEVSVTPEGKVILAAALPESATDDVAEALDAAKLSVVKVDALVLGALRSVWGSFKTDDGARRLLILKSVDCLSLVVLDGDVPVAIRAITDADDLKLVKTLILLEAEDFGGPKALLETIEREVDANVALEGIAARATDPSTLNALPESWGEVLAETRFKGKLKRNLAIAGSLWVLVMAVLFGVPFGYGFLTDHVKDLCRQHKRQYDHVKEKKEKTELVQKYSDHARGALEIMKASSDRLPPGITLSGWDFKRGEGLRLRGEADDKSAIYEYKDKVVAMGTEGEEGGEAVFKVVNLGSVSSQKTGQQKFDLECRFEEEDHE